MCSRLLIVTACLLAVAAGPAFAQNPPSRKPPPPEKVAGKTLEQWVRDLERADPSVREAAARALPYFGDSARVAVPTLLAVLQNDSDVACRVYACLALSAVADDVGDKEALRAVKVLAEKADSDLQSIVRLFAVLALRSFGPRATQAIPVLVNHLHDPSSWELRQAVVFALGTIAADKKFGPDGKTVLALANLLIGEEKNGGPERSARVRLAAVMALRVLGRPTGDAEGQAAKHALLLALKDHDKAVSVWALAALIATDEATDERLSQLALNLKGRDVMAKVSAASALGALGEKTAGSRIPEIIELLDDTDPLVRATAIDVLSGFGPAAKAAVPGLRKVMDKKDQGDYFKRAAAYAIEKISGEKVKPPPAAPAPPPGTSKAADPTEVGGRTLEQWIKDIRDPDPSLRETAIQAVPYFGRSAKAAVPALVSRLHQGAEPDVACRVHAAIALAAIADSVPSSESGEAVKVLAERADRDGQSIVRYYAVIALGSFGAQATSTIPSLINRIHDTASWEVRQSAVQALANIAAKEEKLGPDGRAVVAIANRLLNDEERSGEVRRSAVMALGVMGRPALDVEFRRAVQALLKAANGDHDKTVQIWAAVAVMAVDKVTDQALARVTKHLKGKDVMAKVTAARALGAMGKEARPVIGDIAALLNDEDPLVISTALDVLAGLGAYAHEAVPALNRFLDKIDARNLKKDDKEYFKDATKYAIDQIEGKGKK
jgi:HEAT repeat protein